MTPEEHLAAALQGLGFKDDAEMENTPTRVATMLARYVPDADLPSSTPLPTSSSAPIVARDLPYYSLCAHHLLPFFGHCTIVYRPNGRIAGLGWFPRVLQYFARQPQLQERLCAQVADAIWDALEPQSVGVLITARQMCVEMRGPSSTGVFETRFWRGTPSAELTQMLG